ncbi:hypothetical protein [Streptomyces lonarensis]|uniref:Uncharacterized protein n=1 Tax=Streptomyces lonarensis TaxID=700599 RepID=A0A7X6CWZ5_9ACTN|nr:hypothetical protein [Streptomyces lonarensis]NJQ04107.1 hypothetical protein [Streptomyces lonarensis]
MDHVVDLDAVAALLAQRAEAWTSAGLEVGQLTWRDGAAPWPQPHHTDRERVHDPDSLGIVVTGPDEAELSIVLFRGGWADVDVIADLDDAGSLPAAGITSTSEVETQLDHWVARVSGAGGGAP